MKKLIYYSEILILCIGIWIILNEEISFTHIALGGLLGIAAILVTNRVLLLTDYKNAYPLDLLVMLRYTLFLLLQIYLSGFSAIIKIITGKINPDIVEIQTELSSELDICILANSITLTPGTVTIDKSGNRLKVLWLDCVTRDSKKAGDLIKGKFEAILMRKK